MSYILTRKAMGEKSLPIISEIAGIPVYINKQTEVPPTDGFVFRWGCIGNVPSGKVVNKVPAIEATTDKRSFRLLLAKHGLSMRSWGSLDEYLLEDAHEVVQSVLLRPEVHTRSENMFLCTKLSEVVKAVKSISGRYYISEFIQKKNEYRIFITQNRVVWMIKKHPKSPDDLTWGCVEEGNFEYLGWGDWKSEGVRVGLESMKLSGLDFGAVDIVEDQDGKFYVLEVNTAPWLSPYYAKCVGKVFKHILQNGRDHFEDPESLNWKHSIHPAIGG